MKPESKRQDTTNLESESVVRKSWVQAFHRKLHDVIAFRGRAVLIHARVYRALALLTKYACFAMFYSHLKLYSNLPVYPACRGTVVPELYTTRIYYLRDLGRKGRRSWNWDRDPKERRGETRIRLYSAKNIFNNFSTSTRWM